MPLRPLPRMTSALVISTGSPALTPSFWNCSAGMDPDHLADVESALFGGKHRLHAAELRFDRAAFDRAHAQLDRNVGLELDDGHYSSPLSSARKACLQCSEQ
jgi:hypothetical protein